MAKRTDFAAPVDLEITNKSKKEIKIPVAGSPDRFIFIEAGKKATVHADVTAEVVFYTDLEKYFPVTVANKSSS